MKSNQIKIYDEMKFFKGDGPASQFKAGKQKGRNHVCLICDINAADRSIYSYLLNRTCSGLKYFNSYYNSSFNI